MDWVISYKKQIFGVASFILLLVAIPATMYLVREQQVVRSRADDEDLNLTLLDQSGQQLTLSSGNLTTSDRNIKVQVVYNPATTSSPTPTFTPTPTVTTTPIPTRTLSPAPTSPPNSPMTLCGGINCQSGGDTDCMRVYGANSRCYFGGAGSGVCIKSPFAGAQDCMSGDNL